MNARTLAGPPAAALGAGLLAWIVAASLDPPPPDALGALDRPAGRPRWILLALALVATGIAIWRMPPEELRRDGVAAWLAAIPLWLAA